MYSLHRTLAVRYSATMFVALLAIALWACIGTTRLLRDELDRSLLAGTRLETAALETGRPLSVQASIGAVDDFVREINRFVVARDSAGRVVSANTPLALDLPLDTAAFQAARRGRESWAAPEHWHDHDLRSRYVPAPRGAPPRHAVVQVSASLAPLDHMARDIFFLMLGTVLLGTVATVYGASWLARSAVRPVLEIADEAEAVAPGRVGQRITAHGDVVEFQTLIRVLNRMLERLDRALLAERRIIRDAGHDLRTPITAIQGEVEVALRRERAAAEYRATLESVLGEVQHLGDISEALITLARLEAGELTPERIPTDLRDLLREVAAGAGGEDGHAITVEGDAVTAAVDPGLMRTAVVQLVDNAVTHTPPGTHVRLRAVDNGQPTVIIEDDGPGVPPEALRHLFERFYRPDDARERRGAGLGLSVVAAVAHVHGGRVRAERSGEHGLRVVMQLAHTPDAAVLSS